MQRRKNSTQRAKKPIEANQTNQTNPMAQIIRMNGSTVPNHLSLIAGNTLPFKVSGFGADKKHILIQSSSPAVKVVSLRADAHSLEQTFRLEISPTAGITRVTLSAHLASNPHQRDGLTPDIAISIEPRLELPHRGDDAGIMARVLIVENFTPLAAEFISIEQARISMQWMRWVMLNRLRFGSQHFGAGKSATSIYALITAPNQVDGFEPYPHMGLKQQQVLDGVLNIANDSTHRNFSTTREYVQAAIDIARGLSVGKDPCPTGLYAWRTEDTRSPGANFVKYQTKAGQDFYTLTEEFRKDPLLRTKGLKNNGAHQ
jgi:hypothetical protein